MRRWRELGAAAGELRLPVAAQGLGVGVRAARWKIDRHLRESRNATERPQKLEIEVSCPGTSLS